MKNIFNIHYSSYFLYIIFILSGYINYLFIYFIIIIVHELGHIIAIKIFKYEIKKIYIYPFGGIIKTNINYNIKSNKLFIISIAGILSQLILFILIKHFKFIDYNIFYNLNISIIIFNLIPIYPSDGSKILISFLERIISYRKLLIISNIISIIVLIISFLYIKNVFIFIVLYIINIKNIINLNYIYNKFKLERYLYKIKNKNKKYIESDKNIYKNKNNYIKYNNIYINEIDYYKDKYSIYY